jgi:hypothetical protein
MIVVKLDAFRVTVSLDSLQALAMQYLIEAANKHAPRVV